jgi:hypothetical protein
LFAIRKKYISTQKGLKIHLLIVGFCTFVEHTCNPSMASLRMEGVSLEACLKEKLLQSIIKMKPFIWSSGSSIRTSNDSRIARRMSVKEFLWAEQKGESRVSIGRPQIAHCQHSGVLVLLLHESSLQDLNGCLYLEGLKIHWLNFPGAMLWDSQDRCLPLLWPQQHPWLNEVLLFCDGSQCWASTASLVTLCWNTSLLIVVPYWPLISSRAGTGQSS